MFVAFLILLGLIFVLGLFFGYMHTCWSRVNCWIWFAIGFAMFAIGLAMWSQTNNCPPFILSFLYNPVTELVLWSLGFLGGNELGRKLAIFVNT